MPKKQLKTANQKVIKKEFQKCRTGNFLMNIINTENIKIYKKIGSPPLQTLNKLKSNLNRRGR